MYIGVFFFYYYYYITTKFRNEKDREKWKKKKKKIDAYNNKRSENKMVAIHCVDVEILSKNILDPKYVY